MPALEATVAKYVENARLFLSPQELERTRQEAERFLQGPGPVLQQKLLERADLKKKENKSWLIDWWNRCACACRALYVWCVCVVVWAQLTVCVVCSWAYMDYKDSVVINVSYAFNFVEPRLGRVSQTRRAAQLIHGAVLFEQQLHKYTSPRVRAVVRVRVRVR